ncbi:MAG: energy transducer TonB [Bacteroidaceae bacterium]|nr:energy transducer TonB [Bacteroidaceae bacterium]MBQ6800024.1 energy transducer TonB [Bacteroidaceae bacterium]
MDNDNKKERIVGLLGTLLVHGVLFFLLWFLFIRASEPQAESGVPVLLGTELLAQGGGDRYEMTEVDVQPVPQEISAQPENNFSQVGEEFISQDIEETVAIEQKKEDKKEENVVPVQPIEQPTPEQPKEKTEAELRAEAEKAAAEAAARSIAGAFGKGNSMSNRGEATTGTGIQGSTEGNSETGKVASTGGYGPKLDLSGRSPIGGLPLPVYNVQEEGMVEVAIDVAPSGKVIRASVRRANTGNSVLRKAAEDAARKAVFNVVDGVDNQTGSITYYFKLK